MQSFSWRALCRWQHAWQHHGWRSPPQSELLGSLRRSSHWFAWHHNGPDAWYFITSYKWILFRPFRVEFSPTHSCSLFPIVFCGNLLLAFFTDLVNSCFSCPLLSVSLNCNCSLHFAYNWLFVILQSHVTSIYFSHPVISASRAR